MNYYQPVKSYESTNQLYVQKIFHDAIHGKSEIVHQELQDVESRLNYKLSKLNYKL